MSVLANYAIGRSISQLFSLLFSFVSYLYASFFLFSPLEGKFVYAGLNERAVDADQTEFTVEGSL